MTKKQIGCSYFGNRFLEHYISDLSKMKAGGFNTILLTVSENDLQYYSETLQKMVDIAKKNRFTVYLDPWGWGGIFGGEADSRLVMLDSSLKQFNQKCEETPSVCPNNPKTFEHLKEWIKFAVSTEADYIFWDEPHFYFKDFKKEKADFGCFCSVCKELYKKKYNEELIYNKRFDFKKMAQFKIDSIIKFINKLTSEVKKYKKKNALCLLPILENEKSGYFDWNRINELKNVDLIGTDPYWFRMKKDKQFVFDFADRIIKIAETRKIKSEIWVQAYKLRIKDLNELKFVIKNLISKKYNFDSIMFWSYRCGYPMSFLQSEKYDYLWNEISNCLKK